MSAAFFVWRLTFCYFMSTDINDLLINITLDRARPESEDDDDDDNDEALPVSSVLAIDGAFFLCKVMFTIFHRDRVKCNVNNFANCLPLSLPHTSFSFCGS